MEIAVAAAERMAAEDAAREAAEATATATAPAPRADDRVTIMPAVRTKKRLYKRQPKNVRARMADLVIRVMVDENPRREDTAAHEHFEKMKGGITIRQYLAKFNERDQCTARRWLYNTIQDGYVKTLGG